MNRKLSTRATDSLASFVGLLLLCVGVLANEWSVARFLSPDGVLTTPTRVDVWVLELFLVVLGVLFIRFRRRKIFHYLSLVSVVCISLLLSLEVILRVINAGVVNDIEELRIVRENPRGTGSYRYKPNLDLIFKIGTGKSAASFHIETNSHGMRWREVPVEKSERRRIAFVGDGYVAGSSAPQYDKSIPGFFESALNNDAYEVLNFGIFAYGPDDMELYLKEEIVPFKPDYLFVVISNGNDFRDAYLGTNKYLKHFDLLPLWNADVLRAKIPEQFLGDPPYSTWSENKKYRTGLDSCETYKLLRGLGQRTSRLLGGTEEQKRIVRRPSDFEVDDRFMAWTFWCRRHYADVAKSAVDSALRYLSSIKEVCDKNNIQLFLVAIPFEQQIYAREASGIDRNGIEFDISYPQKYLEEFAKRRSVPYLDLLPVLRAYVREKREVYPAYRSDMHFTFETDSLIANVLVDFFTKKVFAGQRQVTRQIDLTDAG